MLKMAIAIERPNAVPQVYDCLRMNPLSALNIRDRNRIRLILFPRGAAFSRSLFQSGAHLSPIKVTARRSTQVRAAGQIIPQAIPMTAGMTMPVTAEGPGDSPEAKKAIMPRK